MLLPAFDDFITVTEGYEIVFHGIRAMFYYGDVVEVVDIVINFWYYTIMLLFLLQAVM